MAAHESLNTQSDSCMHVLVCINLIVNLVVIYMLTACSNFINPTQNFGPNKCPVMKF